MSEESEALIAAEMYTLNIESINLSSYSLNWLFSIEPVHCVKKTLMT
jgi:hypothetical protein